MIVPGGSRAERATCELAEHHGHRSRGDAASPVLSGDPVTNGVRPILWRNVDGADHHAVGQDDTRRDPCGLTRGLGEDFRPACLECGPVTRLRARERIGRFVEFEGMEYPHVGDGRAAEGDLG